MTDPKNYPNTKPDNAEQPKRPGTPNEPLKPNAPDAPGKTPKGSDAER